VPGHGRRRSALTGKPVVREDFTEARIKIACPTGGSRDRRPDALGVAGGGEVGPTPSTGIRSLIEWVVRWGRIFW
jgi:hypothetical protein